MEDIEDNFLGVHVSFEEKLFQYVLDVGRSQADQREVVTVGFSRLRCVIVCFRVHFACVLCHRRFRVRSVDVVELLLHFREGRAEIFQRCVHLEAFVMSIVFRGLRLCLVFFLVAHMGVCVAGSTVSEW